MTNQNKGAADAAAREDFPREVAFRVLYQDL